MIQSKETQENPLTVLINATQKSPFLECEGREPWMDLS